MLPYRHIMTRPVLCRSSILLRAFSTSQVHKSTPVDPFKPSPSPPRLPPEQQAEFERLQRKASTLPLPPAAGESMDAKTSSSATTINLTTAKSAQEPSATTTMTTTSSTEQDGALGAEAGKSAGTQAKAATETSSGGVFRGAPPEFEGEVNPKTGEVGGPKNDPLRWGAGGDWSYNGRTTDF